LRRKFRIYNADRQHNFELINFNSNIIILCVVPTTTYIKLKIISKWLSSLAVLHNRLKYSYNFFIIFHGIVDRDRVGQFFIAPNNKNNIIDNVIPY